ncbi:MAG: hypothetical protein AB7N76_37015 [Planctomycetota bacterium]
MSIPPDKIAIGKALLAGGPITQELLQRELVSSGKGDSVLGKALLQSGFPSEEALIAPLLQRLRIPKINARNTKIPLETIRVVPESVARACRVLAIDKIGEILVVVTPSLDSEANMAEVRRKTGLLVTPIQCAPEGFDQIVDEYYQRLNESGLALPEPTEVGAAPAHAGVNGALQAIPAGPEHEDSFFKRFMSGGPLRAEEVQL